MPIQWPFKGNTIPKIYKFFRFETGQFEDVPLERWRWQAIYNDGCVLNQFDDKDDLFHQFAEIDQSRLKSFRMFSDQNPVGFSLAFSPTTMKLIHFYRHVVLNYGTADEQRYKIYCFGYEKKDGSKADPYLLFILPDDSVVLDQSSVKEFL